MIMMIKIYQKNKKKSFLVQENWYALVSLGAIWVEICRSEKMKDLEND